MHWLKTLSTMVHFGKSWGGRTLKTQSTNLATSSRVYSRAESRIQQLMISLNEGMYDSVSLARAKTSLAIGAGWRYLEAILKFGETLQGVISLVQAFLPQTVPSYNLN